jgi:MFS family permease
MDRSEGVIETHIPARMDRLPWSKFHWLVVIGLGVTWILDGLEVTLAGAIGGVLKTTFHISDAQVGATATAYLIGAVVGALGFGYATDRLGRKKLFTITLLVYLVATAASALSWDFWSYMVFRAITGMGIGGGYAAINSAIDELIPAKVRGRVDLVINSTYWVGAALGAGATVILLNGNLVRATVGWRYAFGIGVLLGIIVIYVRKFIPESPRWLMTHGHEENANKIVEDIERQVEAEHGKLPPPDGKPLRLRVRERTPWSEIWNVVAHQHASRSLLGLTLMVAQAFFYNAIFFTYALVLISFYGIDAGKVGQYLLWFALGNVAGPVAIGHFFDTIGRRKMISLTYGLSGIMLAVTAWLFKANLLTAQTQTICWTATFFIASCAASAAYLTVSEIFPLEIRALAISLFYAVGTLVGGVGAPYIYGALIGTHRRSSLFWGYLFGAALMLVAAVVEIFLGVDAEGQSLENISTPLSADVQAT